MASNDRSSQKTLTERNRSTPCVRYEKRGRVAYITLNRPDKLNAMNSRMHKELKLIWDNFEADNYMQIAVITGAGERAFSVGRDLKELVDHPEQVRYPGRLGSRGGPGWPRLTERLSMSKPVIARVDGYAYGGGFELALACDVTIASDRAIFALPEAKLGLIPGGGGLFRLVRQIPMKLAMGHLLTGNPIHANRAYELGLVNEVVSPVDLDACVQRWVHEILRCAPFSVRAIKQIALDSAHLSLRQAFAKYYEAEHRRQESADSREGPLAFVEKRHPTWSN